MQNGIITIKRLERAYALCMRYDGILGIETIMSFRDLGQFLHGGGGRWEGGRAWRVSRSLSRVCLPREYSGTGTRRKQHYQWRIYRQEGFLDKCCTSLANITNDVPCMYILIQRE